MDLDLRAPVRAGHRALAGVRAVARVVAVVAALLAVADGFRWGNRWYLSTRFAAADKPTYAGELLAAAHAALVHGLVLTLVALVAAAVGWRLRVVRAR